MFRKLEALHALDADRLIGWFAGENARICSMRDLPLKKTERAAVRKIGGASAAYIAAEGYGIAWSSDIGITADAFYDASQAYNPAPGLQERLLAEIVDARKQTTLTQAQLESVSGVRQPVIARMERGASSPRLDTVIKVLAPLGKTLAVVDLA